jgi:hypothetical protein
MEIYLKKRGNNLFPAYDSDLEMVQKLSLDEVYKCVLTRPRNYQFHKKFFALLNLAYNNQDQFDNFEKFRFVMMMKAGHFETIKTGKGVVYMPQSISFAKMSEDEFETVYNDMLKEVEELIGAEVDPKELESFM